MSINSLHNAKFIASAAYVINIIINAPAESCTPKQIDLQAFLLLQLPYFASVFIVITSGCKSADAQYKRLYYLAPPQSILTK